MHKLAIAVLALAVVAQPPHKPKPKPDDFPMPTCLPDDKGCIVQWCKDTQICRVSYGQ